MGAKRLVQWALTGFMFVALTGCDRSNRIRLTVYSPHGPEMMAHFEKAFELEYPEVDVRVIELGSERLLGRIRGEKANPRCDVWWGAPWYMFDQAAEEGLLQPYRPTWAHEATEQERHPEDLWYGSFLMHQVILYNSEVLDRQSAPQSWKDLAEEPWNDKIIIRFPLDSGTMRTIFSVLTLSQADSDGNLERGYRYLAGLDANTKEYASEPVILYNKIARREGTVSLWNLTDIVLQANKYPFNYIIPSEGTPILLDCIALVAGSPQPDWAKKYYEYVTSIDSQVVEANRFYRFPARHDIPSDKLPKWMNDFIREQRIMEVDWNAVASRQKEIMDYWNQHIRGRGADYLAESSNMKPAP